MKNSKHLIGVIFASLSIFLFTGKAFSQEKDNSEKHHNHHSGMKVEKKGDDSLLIHINKHEFGHLDFSGSPFACGKGKHKFNGHWAGVELGWNGYVNSDYNMIFPANQQYLNLNVARSMMVNLNLFDLNLNLIKNHFGFTTGLGFQFSNYFFNQNYKLMADTTFLTAFRVYDDNGNAANLKINKLTVSWLNVPILFEYQTNSGIKMNSFHIAVGVIGGVRIGTYQKQTFDTWNTFYYLKDSYGKPVGSFYAGQEYIRTKNAFYLENFKLDATARIGWSFLNFFATCSITPMFQDKKAPQVYPWTVGISLVGW